MAADDSVYAPRPVEVTATDQFWIGPFGLSWPSAVVCVTIVELAVLDVRLDPWPAFASALDRKPRKRSSWPQGELQWLFNVPVMLLSGCAIWERPSDFM